MSTFNYARIAEIATKQVKRFGQSVIIIRRTQGAYNPATSTAPVDESTQTGVGVVDKYQYKEIDGYLIKSADLKLILSTEGIDRPEENDSAELVSGDRFTIKSVEEIAPGGTTVLYICQLRR